MSLGSLELWWHHAWVPHIMVTSHLCPSEVPQAVVPSHLHPLGSPSLGQHRCRPHCPMSPLGSPAAVAACRVLMARVPGAWQRCLGRVTPILAHQCHPGTPRRCPAGDTGSPCAEQPQLLPGLPVSPAPA